jgi:imidazolonepropionase-like amidohydrolase
MAKSEKTVVRATTLFDGKRLLKDRLIVLSGGKIVDISAGKAKAEFEGFVTPALIDAHSHIGMFREGEPGGEQEGNEFLHQILPTSDPLNSVYFDDRAFKDAIDFGVLYSCIIPGSGNLFGGKAKIIRHAARHRGEALIKDYGYKMALGFNPRSTTGWRGDRPNTRMGIYGMLEKRFDEVLSRYRKAELAQERKIRELDKKIDKKEIAKGLLKRERELIAEEFSLEFSPEDQALLDVLIRKHTVKVHVHKEDDVLYLIDLVRKYKLSVTAEHTGDVFHREIFDLLADNNISIVYGPLGSFAYKVELAHAYYQNTKHLMDSRANFGLMTDHPVIHVTALRDSTKFFMMFGMSDVDALALITRKNAEILGIDDQLGSIAVGKRASLLLWDRDPMHLAAKPSHVFEDGLRLR